uniref:Uncharacterized protein n=1 Tax=Arundo donax TaxID=35708 RepID=A0A0A9BNY2_ARUDO
MFLSSDKLLVHREIQGPRDQSI